MRHTDNVTVKSFQKVMGLPWLNYITYSRLFAKLLCVQTGQQSYYILHVIKTGFYTRIPLLEAENLACPAKDFPPSANMHIAHICWQVHFCFQPVEYSAALPPTLFHSKTYRKNWADSIKKFGQIKSWHTWKIACSKL